MSTFEKFVSGSTGAPEFSRLLDVRQVEGRDIDLVATEKERAALAARFDLVRIDRLEGKLILEAERDAGIVRVKGTLWADIVQSCAISAEDLPVKVEEVFSFRFVPAGTDYSPDEEIELASDDCDEIEYSGMNVDVGEALAQSLALAIDPFAAGPNANTVREKVGLSEPPKDSPFAALSALKKNS